MIKAKINLLSLIAAAALFALPWIEIQCSQQPLAVQTGFETVYGGVSPAPEFKEMMESEGAKESDSEDGPDIAILAAAALLFVVIGILAAFKAMQDGSEGAGSARFALLAFLCLVIQMVIGFPAANEVKESMEQEQQDMQGIVFTTEYQTGLYLTLLALLVPTVVRFLIPDTEFDQSESSFASTPTGPTGQTGPFPPPPENPTEPTGLPPQGPPPADKS